MKNYYVLDGGCNGRKSHNNSQSDEVISYICLYEDEKKVKRDFFSVSFTHEWDY